MYAIELGAAEYDPGDAVTNVFGADYAMLPDTAENGVLAGAVPLAGVVRAVVVRMRRRGVAPDPIDLLGTCTLRINASVSVAIGSIVFPGGAAPVESQVVTTGLASAIAAGQSLRFFVLSPTWATTNPTLIAVHATVLIEDSAEAAAEAALRQWLVDWRPGAGMVYRGT